MVVAVQLESNGQEEETGPLDQVGVPWIGVSIPLQCTRTIRTSL